MRLIMEGKLGAQGGTAAFALIFILIIVAAFLYFTYSPGPSPLPITEGVLVNYSYPNLISPSSSFSINFRVSNNLAGNSAKNINLCLDDLGLFSVSSSSHCVGIPSLFAGGVLSESFSLTSPSVGEYGNIPYTQDIGYFVNFSYTSSATQSVIFASQNTLSSGATIPSTSFSRTAGPVAVATSVTPVAYGNDALLQLILDNVGNGIVLGPVAMNISMNSAFINITTPPDGAKVFSYPNGTTVFSFLLNLGTSSLTMEMPIGLSPAEMSGLTSTSAPYSPPFDVHVALSYNYEEDGFFPIYLSAETYTYS